MRIAPIHSQSGAELFEALDYLDLRLIYCDISWVSQIRHVSISKVSRSSRKLLDDLARPGFPLDLAQASLVLDDSWLKLLRHSFQEWRLQKGRVKILPTFSTVAALRRDGSSFDVLSDIHLTAKSIAEHLLERRIDIMLSSDLDLGGELVAQALQDAGLPFTAIPLMEDEVMAGLHPGHALQEQLVINPEDAASHLTAAYPEGMAQLGAAAFRERGLWRFPCRYKGFDVRDWYLDQPNTKAICYTSALHCASIPEARDLTAIPFSKPLRQTTYLIMLKALAGHPAIESAVDSIRGNLAGALADAHQPVGLL